MGFGTNLLELIYRYPRATKETPMVGHLTQSATSEEVFAAAIATAAFQGSFVRVNDSAASNGSANIIATHIPK